MYIYILVYVVCIGNIYNTLRGSFIISTYCVNKSIIISAFLSITIVEIIKVFAMEYNGEYVVH